MAWERERTKGQQVEAGERTQLAATAGVPNDCYWTLMHIHLLD